MKANASFYKKYLERKYAISAPLRLLGQGQEGFVFTDTKQIYKIFRAEKGAMTPECASLLGNCLGQATFNALYPLMVSGDGTNQNPFVVQYPYEKSRPYSGGFAQDMCDFLLECKQAGILSRNIHPDNFIVTRNGLKFIDYGRDIVPFNEGDFPLVVKRAWLSLLYWHRQDLKQIMRTSLHRDDLPELDGFADFFFTLSKAGMQTDRTLLLPSAFSPQPQGKQLDPLILGYALQGQPSKALDFGCGKGKTAEALAKAGVEVYAWDPDKKRIEVNKARKSTVRYHDSVAPIVEEGIFFDVIVCSLVLCHVDDAEAKHILHTLRSMIAPSGKVVLSICNPFFNTLRSDNYHCKQPAGSYNYHEHFTLENRSPFSGQRFTDYHRPLEWYKKELARAGFAIESITETSSLNPKNGRDFSDYLLMNVRPLPLPSKKADLIIRVCALEHDTIEHQVAHIVRQIGCSPSVNKIILQVDTRKSTFTRSHGNPDFQALSEKIATMLQRNLFDAVAYGPESTEDIQAVNRRWFSLDCASPCSPKSEPTAASLKAFEHCTAEYIVAVDADIMFYCLEGHDPIGEAIEILEGNPQAVSISLNIAKKTDTPVHASCDGKPNRIEVRTAVYNRKELLDARPFDNSVSEGLLALPWHRALDKTIERKGFTSLRGGSSKAGFVHPPNALKIPRQGWLAVMDRLEAGFVPSNQFGHVDLETKDQERFGLKRSEPFVFIINGRNVSHDRMKRCITSLSRQAHTNWGAVITDDESTNGSGEYLEYLCKPLAHKITLLRNRVRLGQMANTFNAIRYSIADPNTVAITLDLDDALLGENVLGILGEVYAKGADATVGSMLRMDKPHARYEISFDNPRKNRGGNVWSHLRTFRKYLFDAIREDDLRLDGQWIRRATDWAFMLPIAEMANHPVFLRELLYLYEPSEKKSLKEVDDPSEREAIIARIVAKPSYDAYQRQKVHKE